MCRTCCGDSRNSLSTSFVSVPSAKDARLRESNRGERSTEGRRGEHTRKRELVEAWTVFPGRRSRDAAREATVRRLGLNLTDSVLALPLPQRVAPPAGRERTASGEGVEAYRVPRASTIISPLRAPAYPARPRRRRGVFIIFTRRYRYPIEPILIPPRISTSPLCSLSLPIFPWLPASCLRIVAEREKEWVGRACGFTRIPPLLESHRGDLLLGSAFLEIGPSSVSETFSIPWRRKSWNIACNLFFVRSPFHSPLLFSPRARFGSLSSLGDKKTSFSYELDVPLNYRVAPPYLTLVLQGSLSL